MNAKEGTCGDVRQWRRLRALRLRRRGWRRRDIAEALGVTEVSVSHWLARARIGGAAALLSRPIPGRPAELSPVQRRMIPEFLWHGAEAYGFCGSLWTCARVAKVIEEEFGVAYEKSQVSRLLKRLGWTPQAPIHRRTLVQEFVSGTHGKVRLEALPGYAPDLNPWDEGGWNHLKNVEMRNGRTLLVGGRILEYLCIFSNRRICRAGSSRGKAGCAGRNRCPDISG
jgi:transposase